ncbi:hypothetical protein [Mycobacterium palustre]|uniref:hypothetical protein n=1 Tax=Mycobacterium palustre TaxID=153971 RepID=UPI003556C050
MRYYEQIGLIAAPGAAAPAAWGRAGRRPPPRPAPRRRGSGRWGLWPWRWR